MLNCRRFKVVSSRSLNVDQIQFSYKKKKKIAVGRIKNQSTTNVFLNINSRLINI